MALTPYINTTEIIRALDDEPNDVGGLTADQLKAKFDLFADEFKEYFNNTHIEEVESEIATIETAANAAKSTADTAKSTADAALHKNLVLPTDNLGYDGITTTETIAIDGSVGEVLYLTSTGYAKAQAADDTKLPCIALRLETGTGDKKILKYGLFKNTSWSFTKGQLIWLSPTTSGAITNTRPSTTGNRVQCIGQAIAVDTIFFNPSPVWLEVG